MFDPETAFARKGQITVLSASVLLLWSVAMMQFD